MLGRPRSGPAQAKLNDTLAHLSTLFEGEGYQPIAAPHLFLGETLLDVYGEDLRARAFLFPDQGRGNELCLRPDFTVPVALAHGTGGWEKPAAYTYQGPVFRNQVQGLGRPVEYLQAGIERYGDTDPIATEVQVFTLLHQGLVALGIHDPEVTLGDLSIPFALIEALEIPGAASDDIQRLKARLKRHFWRPHRFQALLDRAATPPVGLARRQKIIVACKGDNGPSRIAELVETSGGLLGVRTLEEVVARSLLVSQEAKIPPMPRAEAQLMRTLMDVTGSALSAPAQLRKLGGPEGFARAIDRFETRLEALSAAGQDPSRMTYDANFGRNLEYYDGLVFEMRAPSSGPHPPLAGGGRYDALTARLGAPRPVAAVGGIIRPEAVLEVLG